jgi:polysaccharide deacetylase 2 family uncharacterized protein YibQ
VADEEARRGGAGRAFMALAILLLLAAAGSAFWLHQTGELALLLAAKPAVDLPLPAPEGADAATQSDAAAPDDGTSAAAPIDAASTEAATTEAAPTEGEPSAASETTPAAAAEEATLTPPPPASPAPGSEPADTLAAASPEAAELTSPEATEPAAPEAAEEATLTPPPPPSPAPGGETAEPAAPSEPDEATPSGPAANETTAAEPAPAEAGEAAAESEATAPGTTELAAAAPPAAPIDPPWRLYARPFPLADPRPRIAIVVTELGLSRAATEAAIDRLPPEVTLAFNPLAPNLQSWIVKARARGHEVMLDLPMEPLAYPSEDPGPNALLASLGEVENLRRLGFLLSRADGYVGVATYMGSRFEGSAELIEPVLRRLAEKGYLFLANRSGPTSEVPAIAAALQLPYAGNDRFLDTEATRVAIDGRLQQLERLARTRMGAVAMGLPYPVTIERVAAWAETLGAKGIALAPVSALVGVVEP